MRSPFALRLFRAAGLALFALVPELAHAGFGLPPTILTVGNTGNCDHATIAAAIAAAPGAGNTVIRISNNVAHTNQAHLIIDKNIELRGGYPGCDLAPADPDARTTIRGNGNDTVVYAFSNGFPRTVILRNLVIREGGSSDTLNERGGGVRVGGPMHVEIRNSLVGDNESFNGAGVYIEGASASLLLDDNTVIGLASGLPGNRAINVGVIGARGGGISCVGADIEIIDARIRGNRSESDGGGIYSDDCAITITPRPAFVEGDDGVNGFVTLFENVADLDGGAIFATDGTITWRSTSSGRFAGRAFGNVAGNSGGTLYLLGNSMLFHAEWVRIEESQASNNGGAVWIGDSARFTLVGAAEMQCSYLTCPAIVDSGFGSLSPPLSGGAIYARDGARVTLAQVVLAGNVAAQSPAIAGFDDGTRITLRDVLVHRNFMTGDNNLSAPIRIGIGAHAELVHVTMAGNLRPGGVLVVPPVSSLLVNGEGTLIEVVNSIFSNDADSVARVVTGAAATGVCLLGHEAASLPGMTIGEPDYVAPLANPPDFSLQATSDALDRCAQFENTPNPLPDLHGGTRPVFTLLKGGFSAGAWDMGAIELQVTVQSIGIFGDGFEDP